MQPTTWNVALSNTSVSARHHIAIRVGDVGLLSVVVSSGESSGESRGESSGKSSGESSGDIGLLSFLRAFSGTGSTGGMKFVGGMNLCSV